MILIRRPHQVQHVAAESSDCWRRLCKEVYQRKRRSFEDAKFQDLLDCIELGSGSFSECSAASSGLYIADVQNLFPQPICDEPVSSEVCRSKHVT